MSPNPKTVLFILPALNGGGAERVLLTILRHLDRNSYTPVLLILSNTGAFIDEVPQDVKVINLHTRHARYAIFKVLQTIHGISPHIVFSTLGYINILLSIFIPFFSKKIHFIARESNTVSVKNRLERFPKLFDWLYKTFYNRFELIISQSLYMKNDLIQHYNISEERIKIIYNPLDFQKITRMAQENIPASFPIKEKINLLAIGRLSYQKGFDRLLHALSLLDNRFHLSILGEGELKNTLQQLAEDLKVGDRVSFLGFQHNPYAYMHYADLLILPSRVEGLPNVVLEANACGLPVVAFDSPGGTSEIIQDSINGFLIKDGDIKALAKKIEYAAAYHFDSNLMKDIIMKRYNVKKIITQYEDLFNTVSARP